MNRKVIPLLNKIIFIHAISSHITFSWEPDTATLEEMEGGVTYGYCKSKEDSKGQLRQTIFMHPTKVPHIRLQPSLTAARLGTLLHEMCMLLLRSVAANSVRLHLRTWGRSLVDMAAHSIESLKLKRILRRSCWGCDDINLGRLMTPETYHGRFGL
jgi:hypothetical protein